MKKRIYTVLFMVGMTIAFIATLAFINELTRAAIEQNALVDRYKSMLYAFNIFPQGYSEENAAQTSTTADIPWTSDAVLSAIGRSIRPLQLPVTNELKQLLAGGFLPAEDSVTIYIHLDTRGKPIAYGFPLKGKGLWGSISAFAVIDSSLQAMVGIDFTEQVETPGLGARILEKEFKYFFRRLDISGFQQGETSAIRLVQKKQQPNTVQPGNSFQTITGATQTVNGVLAMVNTDINFYVHLIKANQDLIEDTFVQ